MPDIFQNFSSGLLSADPGAAGTTLNSGNFAFLPVVAAPNTLRLSLDPEGIIGTPEIVVVTAHTAFALTCTVTRGQETAFGAGPARAHAIDTIWRHSLTRQSIVEIMVPAGSIVATVASTPDAGYLMIDGSTVTGAQTLYPATWARIPSSWKSGTNMIMPDARGKTLFMDDAAAAFTLGATGGANTKTLTQANLPAVGISVDPPATAVGGGSVLSLGSGFGKDLGSPVGGAAPGYTPATGSVNISSFTSGNLGSGTALDVTPANLCINWQIKVH